MTRCDYDAVFYRVFCITLLAIAFTFTIILTNVFIDIDGLLANKHGKHKPSMILKDDDTEEFSMDPISKDDTAYKDKEDSYRTKRSIESQNILFHIQNPKMKNILTNRLTTLLEALDEEENRYKIKNTKRPEIKEGTVDVITAVEVDKEQEETKKQTDEDMLHLTMHNILLQGIIGHMNINDVYSRVNTILHNFNKFEHHGDKRKKETVDFWKTNHEDRNYKPPIPDKMASEIIKCQKLQDKVIQTAVKTDAFSTGIDTQTTNLIEPRVTEKAVPKKIIQDVPVVNKTEPAIPDTPADQVGTNMFVKTIIDIKPASNDRNNTLSKDNVHGIIELIYNGKTMKFSHPDNDNQQIQTTHKYQPENTTQAATTIAHELKKVPKDYINTFMAEYFKYFPKGTRNATDDIKNSKNEMKRHKRHVKVKIKKDENATHVPHKKHTKKTSDDDDLYVEIETHIDSKSIKGDKKKKLIKNLIDRIQKAINTDDTKQNNNTVVKKKNRTWRVRKRIQDPLEFNDRIMINKMGVPIEHMVQRQLNPITILKTIPKRESAINVKDKSGDSWKKDYIGPTFLASTKTINSAEMSELDVDYKNVMNINGIPQRLQKPLNTDMSEETMNPEGFYDLSDMNNYYSKDIDGSGFSNNYNQYSEAPPDPETIKLYTGVENVIKTYHQADGQIPERNMDLGWENDDRQNTSIQDNHVIFRRSINEEHDYHSNEYKIIYDGHALPYNSYKDIYQRQKSKTDIEFRRSNQFLDLPLKIDDDIFTKNLKPSEIFGLANLFRRKRSMNVKKISNLRKKFKLNRFLNTKSMSTKSIFLNKKRNKRQINKIRIIASDYPHKHGSNENIFVLADDENVYADRAVVKDAETSDDEKQDDTDILPFNPDMNDDTPTYKIFDGKSRHNALMSKYPHVFMEEINRSNEDFSPENTMLFRKMPSFTKLAAQTLEVTNIDDKSLPEHLPYQTTEATTVDEPIKEGVEDIVNALQTPKYKITLKILPKNLTAGPRAGFKEIHTSINKKISKNGLQYLSLVNVSEISKVTDLNKTKDQKEEYTKPTDSYMANKMNDEQDKMQMMLREHQKNIDEQLNRLNDEKVKIESILVDENNTSVPHCDYLDNILQIKPHKHTHIDENPVKIPIHSHYKEPIVTTLPTTTTHQPTTTMSTTTTVSTPPPLLFNDKLKKRILHTIERNENLTDQILKKIDKNTEILQSFLKKLTNNLEQKPVEQKRYIEDSRTEKLMTKYEPYNYANDWRAHQAPISINPNYFMRRNDSHLAIPFVYTYQQSLNPHKMNAPVASVVYHGHIHANNIHGRDMGSMEKEKLMPVHKKIDSNQTRFFLDELESDYKVIPVHSIKMHKNSTML